ncbi:MAG: hypothetical protein CL842_09095 [Crocinitomicaceae bacterium]|nr:hypothetical protein [Crocinitomicaceae bacterium]|tara:strand:- start:284270 stop:286660 length:2391 start_codon:yes stop_codon:yes gene_type:complete
MRKINLLLGMLLFSAIAFAQAPNKMSYQAVVRGAADQLLANKAIGVQVTIEQGTAGGAAVYVETFTPTTNSNGLVTLEIGTGNIVSGDITTIDWENGPYFIKTETDPTGGTSYSLAGTTELMSVPYALHARKAAIADSVVGGTTESDPVFTASPAGGISGSDISNWNLDTSITNEIQILSISNDTIYLSDGGFAVLPVAVNNDNDSTNEIQQLISSNDTLYLNNGGGFVTFTYLINWLQNSNDLYFETGNVAIGHDSPEHPLHIYDSVAHTGSDYKNGFLMQSRITNTTSGSDYAGIYSDVKGTDAYNTAVDGTSSGISSGTNYGVGGYARNATTNVGVEAFANGNNQVNYGIDAFSWNGSKNYGVKGFVRANSDTADHHVGVLASVDAKNGLGTALWAKSTGTRSGNAIYAESLNDSSNIGINAFAKSSSSNNTDQYGIKGTAEGSGSTGTGVHYGVYGTANGSGLNNIGTYGLAQSTSSAANSANRGVFGNGNSTSSVFNQGVLGIAIPTRNSTTGYNAGVLGEAAGHSNTNYGFISLNYGTGNTNYGSADFAYGSVTGSKKNIGSYAYAFGADTNIAVRAYAKDDAGSVNYGVYSEVAGIAGSMAGRFIGNTRVEGNLVVTGSISKGSGTFKIDHPDDPENKFLVHSFVESPDMMNVYNGNAITDANGFVTVELPDYVENANKDYRYQLTPIGQFAQCIIKEKVKGNKFVIQTDKPNVEVSWMITGIRSDPYANQNRIVPVVDKDQNEKGKYLHPEAYGKDDSYNMYQPLDLGNAKEEFEMVKKSSANPKVEK